MIALANWVWALAAYLVAAFVVVPLIWWAACTPGRRTERALGHRQLMRELEGRE